MQNKQNKKIADASDDNWVDRFAPEFMKPYLRLMRLDRPIGFWLLFWPCAFSLFLADIAAPQMPVNWYFLVLFFVGAIVMRGAGCTFNDIIDRDIDKKVARTALRPIASGKVSVKKATIFLVAQLLIGLIILLQFNFFTIILGASSLILVVIYPFMKRITWWPQLFLGLAFSWGALMGWAAVFGSLSIAPILLYIGCIFWTIGYDTIYAMQDIEDDALIGVKSTARLFGKKAKIIIALFYFFAASFWLSSSALIVVEKINLIIFIPVFAILTIQIIKLNPEKQGNSLHLFKANHFVGLALTMTFLLLNLI